MTKSSIKILLAAFLVGVVYGCDDDSVSTIGSTLTGSDVTITIDSSFTVSGKTLRIENIRPKSTSFILGKLAIENYGSIRSDVVTQFIPSVELDTAEYTSANVDSLFLTLFYNNGDYIGDSIAPMGLTVYPLTKMLPSDIDSDFDPTGYYDETPLTTAIYNTLPESNKLNSSETYRQIQIKLPSELGKHLFKSFEDNPSNFANGKVFSQNVFPGVYMKSSFGSGRMTTISNTALTFHLSKVEEIVNDSITYDTISDIHQYMLVTPEVVSNNNLTYTMSSELQRLYDEGTNMLVAPAGYEMEIRLPGKELAEAFRSANPDHAVLNNLTMTIPCDSIANNASVTPPPYVLLVPKSQRDEFFAKNKLTNDTTSFYATYTPGIGYSFSNLRPYLKKLLEQDEITEEDCTFSLVPVAVNFETSSSSSYYYGTSYIETDIQPYLLSPVMTTIDLSKAKIKLYYTTQTIR